MEDAIKRAIERQFPELTGQYHLPRFAEVIGVSDAPADAGICDDFRPRYAVDLQVLTPEGVPDTSLPVLNSVPLPVATAGTEMGLFGFPEEGTRVVVSFAYGLPTCPYIQSVLPHGQSLPKVPKGDLLLQHSDAAQMRCDADGNWTRQTDGRIRDASIEREVESNSNQERYQSHAQDVANHSTENVGGIKRIDALGALKLNSAGSASLAALGDQHLAAGRNQNVAVAGDQVVTVGGDMAEKIAGLRESVTQGSQRLIGAKNHVGSGNVNIFQVVVDLLDLVEQMNTQIAAHVHPQVGQPPVNAAAFIIDAANASKLSALLATATL